MLKSFSDFATAAFFADSVLYPHGDGTNRHGIAHGAYSGVHYGSPLNFYKTIGAVDFLAYVSGFRAPTCPIFRPDPTPVSLRLAAYYRSLTVIRIEVSKLYESG